MKYNIYRYTDDGVEFVDENVSEQVARRTLRRMELAVSIVKDYDGRLRAIVGWNAEIGCAKPVDPYAYM